MLGSLVPGSSALRKRNQKMAKSRSVLENFGVRHPTRKNEGPSFVLLRMTMSQMYVLSTTVGNLFNISERNKSFENKYVWFLEILNKWKYYFGGSILF